MNRGTSQEVSAEILALQTRSRRGRAEILERKTQRIQALRGFMSSWML